MLIDCGEKFTEKVWRKINKKHSIEMKSKCITYICSVSVKKFKSLSSAGVMPQRIEAFSFSAYEYSTMKSLTSYKARASELRSLTKVPRSVCSSLLRMMTVPDPWLNNFKCLRWAFVICYPQTAETFGSCKNSSMGGGGEFAFHYLPNQTHSLSNAVI
jgi:hypothetical protein